LLNREWRIGQIGKAVNDRSNGVWVLTPTDTQFSGLSLGF